MPYFLYPFICRWTLRLLPCLGDCKQCWVSKLFPWIWLLSQTRLRPEAPRVSVEYLLISPQGCLVYGKNSPSICSLLDSTGHTGSETSGIQAEDLEFTLADFTAQDEFIFQNITAFLVSPRTWLMVCRKHWIWNYKLASLLLIQWLPFYRWEALHCGRYLFAVSSAYLKGSWHVSFHQQLNPTAREEKGGRGDKRRRKSLSSLSSWSLSLDSST